MVRIAKETDPVKLNELKVKINDQNYLKIAIDLIAVRLTDEIINRSGSENEWKT